MVKGESDPSVFLVKDDGVLDQGDFSEDREEGAGSSNAPSRVEWT